MFKKVLLAIWNFILPKTTIDEIELRSINVKKEIEDVVDAIKGVPTKPKKRYYKPKTKVEPKK